MEKEAIIKSRIVKEESEFKKNLLHILKGSIFAIILSALLLLIFALLLTHTNVSENTIVPVVLSITGISILIGSSMSSIKIKKHGLINGGTVGLIYVFILYLASSICFTGFSLTINSFIMLVVGIITGILGGIIGVNLK